MNGEGRACRSHHRSIASSHHLPASRPASAGFSSVASAFDAVVPWPGLAVPRRGKGADQKRAFSDSWSKLSPTIPPTRQRALRSPIPNGKQRKIAFRPPDQTVYPTIPQLSPTSVRYAGVSVACPALAAVVGAAADGRVEGEVTVGRVPGTEVPR